MDFMKRKRLLFVLILLCLFDFTKILPVRAHPADVYTHSIYVVLARDDLSIEWEIKPGPMLISYIWFNADADQDGMVGADEAQGWAESRVSNFTAILNNAQLPLQLEDVQFPSSENSFQAGEQFITIRLSAGWPEDLGDSYKLSLHNGVEQQKSLNWYFINSQDGISFEAPQQKNSSIVFEVLRIPAQDSSQTTRLTTWDSSRPSLSSSQSDADIVTQTAQQVVPELAQNTPQEVLLDLVRSRDFSLSFYAFALGISLVLGALHALTPGHGKTVVAAYLVGSRGTTRHAIVLGSVVTLTHTGSVFLLGLVTLMASKYILPTSIIPVLEIVSGLLIVGLGLYLFWQRYKNWRGDKAHAQAHARGMEHDHHHQSHDHDPQHSHSHAVPEAITWRSLIALGVSGGLVPCPDAIAILLVAVAINRILLGLALILSFSLGLAVVLIVIGLLMVNSRRLFDRFDAFSRFAPIMPIVSAAVVLVLGLALTYGAYTRVKEGMQNAGAATASMNETQLLYLAEDDNQVTQLFIMDYKEGAARVLVESRNGVIEYALSPDRSRVAYVVRTADLGNEIWMVDLATLAAGKISDCTDAACSQPIWSPDGNRLVYEHLSLSNDNATGLATLWWVDVNTGAARPVFQESQLPGANPRWSPDGRWLSYAASENVRLYNLETGESRVVKSILGSSAAWSPDGKFVLYRDVLIQNNQFITQLFVYDLEAKTSTNISPDPGFENILAAWSPDGEWVAVVRRDLSVPRGDQIWLMRVDGSDARALTGAPAVLHGSLDWSSDGRYLLYDVYQLDSFPLLSGLQIMDVNSGEVTDLGINGYNPRWLGLE